MQKYHEYSIYNRPALVAIGCQCKSVFCSGDAGLESCTTPRLTTQLKHNKNTSLSLKSRKQSCPANDITQLPVQTKGFCTTHFTKDPFVRFVKTSGLEIIKKNHSTKLDSKLDRTKYHGLGEKTNKDRKRFGRRDGKGIHNERMKER